MEAGSQLETVSWQASHTEITGGARSEEQGPSNSGKKPEQDDGQGGSRRSEEPMQQDPDQAEKEDKKASTGGVSSLDLNFFSNF